MTQITIFGAGSIGCYLGGRAVEGGASVRFIGRDRYKAAVVENGLSLSQFDDPATQLDGIDFQTDMSALIGSDIIGLCVKSQDTEEAAKLIQQYAPTAWVISFQNGVSNLPTLRDALPEARISGAVVPFNVTSPSPGHFHRGTTGDLIIGPDAPDALLAPFQRATVGVQVVDDIEGNLWAKLLVNLNNALNALSGGPLRDGLMQRGYRRVLVRMIKEGLTVADAESVRVATFNGRHPDALLKIMSKPDWLYRTIMDRVAKVDRTARSSMLDDLEMGRASELDYLQGEIVRRAERLGLDVPVTRAVMTATEAAFAQKSSPRMSGNAMVQRFL
ncbi:2-dehydropantoate 2-reductase [Algimonas arctica]|uniref:2-dehydropantoate 2-reductase n=1 Tax=Algimonas arctica TaxID=1479486 RepID=A0A8J3CR29_9PROT|nr:2-dehydropantoate 2-reductase [Algimonas arctica]GHA88950.1 2-dehydropantoate 2-reductase [Algimonas arctica]